MRMSNSACLNGGAILFFDDLCPRAVTYRVPFSFRVSIWRTSMRTEENLSALPPVVVSGDPKKTPIFSRSWLIKIAVVPVPDSAPVIFRSACDIRRACNQHGSHHLALPGLRNERGNRVNNDDVNTAGADKHVRDLEGLFTSIWLRNQQRISVNA